MTLRKGHSANKKQEAWDQYMQPANLHLDPMANLWSTNSNNNNFYSQNPTASPEQNTGSTSSAASYDINNNYFAGSQQAQPQADTTANGDVTSDTGNAGDTFMGASTPGWKWTVMDDTKK